jgi:hypothetical protein
LRFDAEPRQQRRASCLQIKDTCQREGCRQVSGLVDGRVPSLVTKSMKVFLYRLFSQDKRHKSLSDAQLPPWTTTPMVESTQDEVGSPSRSK